MMNKLLGINDEQTTCDHCGKSNLKKTVIIDMSGEIVRYGIDCAAKVFGKKSGVVKQNASAAEYASKWIAKGRSLEIVANAVWNLYGLSTEVKNGQIVIAGQVL